MAQISFCGNRRNLRIEVGAGRGGAGAGLLNNETRNAGEKPVHGFMGS
jgi:hypothetical protein